MKVQELMELLADCDPDAEVLLASQPHWPFEYDVYGVAARKDVLCPGDWTSDDECCGICAMHMNDHPDWPEDCDASDVLILEGRQLRYGSKEAWGKGR